MVTQLKIIILSCFGETGDKGRVGSLSKSVSWCTTVVGQESGIEIPVIWWLVVVISLCCSGPEVRAVHGT